MNKYYLEILSYLKSGEFLPGAELPSLRELSDRFRASEEEIQVALSELIYEGVLERERPVPSLKYNNPEAEAVGFPWWKS